MVLRCVCGGQASILGFDGSVMQLYSTLSDRQPQSRSAAVVNASLFHAEEWVKDAAQRFVWNSRPIVPDLDNRLLRSF